MRTTLRCLTIALTLLAAPAAWADSLTIDALDRGWYRSAELGFGSYHDPSNMNYIVGSGRPPDTSGTPTTVEFRNFFVFDLASVAGWSVTGATLHLFNPVAGVPSTALTPSDGYRSPDPTETFQVSQVTTDAAALRDGSAGLAGYNDLGDGTAFGSVVASAADNGSFIDVLLNEAAVAALNESAGQLFSIGGALTSLAPGYGQNLFASTNSQFFDPAYLALTELVLDVARIDEPPTLALLAFTLLLLAAARRRA